MQTFELRPHPDYPCHADIGLEVGVQRQGGALTLEYWLYDLEDSVVLPVQGRGERIDGLWKHTCFEAFVRPDERAAYSELNLSPWGDWAAYAFDRYRSGMRDLSGPFQPPVGREGPREDGFYSWGYNVTSLPHPSLDWRIGLSTVIELGDGTKSYWALAHPPGPPDFHNPACFAARLPAPARP